MAELDPKAMYKLSYGLFVLTTKLGDKVNGCITNTGIQVTSSPNRIAFAVNKANLTHDMLLETCDLYKEIYESQYKKEGAV